MMRRLRMLLAALGIALLGVFIAPAPAHAVCGDGELGGACYCPPVWFINCWG